MELPPTSPSLAELVERVEAVLPRNRSESTADLLRLLCSLVPADRRQEVLAALPDEAATEPELRLGPTSPLPETSPGADIVKECDLFVRRLEDGHYFERVAFDEERHEERSYGDESWAREMDELFARAATAYLSENQELAARLYGRLLGVFRHRQRVGVFCGPEAPERMVQTDTDEAKRRYLRSLFLVTAAEDRAARLLTEVERLTDVGQSDITLQSLMDAGPDGDPALVYDDLLPDWIDALKRASRESRGWGREARRFLREAVELHAGVDGLGRLARAEGSEHALAWHAWVGTLVRHERVEEAMVAAREGIAVIRDVTYRARLADRLALLAAARGDHELMLEGALSAWRAQPTEVRLLQLVAASDSVDRRTRILEREASAVLRPDWGHSDALACRLLLLVGRVEQAMTRFQRADALGWGRPDHAGSVVLPFALLATTSNHSAPAGSAIETLWGELDAPGRNYFDRRLLLDRMGVSGSSETVLDAPRPYSALLLEAARTHRIAKSYVTRTLDSVQLKIESAVRDILASHHRRGQTLAATITIALAETLVLVRSETDGMAFFRNMRKAWYRFSAYVDALEDGREQSPLLPDKVIAHPSFGSQDWGTMDERL